MRVINLLDPFAIDQDLLETTPEFSDQWACGADFTHMPSMEGFRLSNQLRRYNGDSQTGQQHLEEQSTSMAIHKKSKVRT